MEEIKIGIILSTTRENRVSDKIGKWVLEEVKKVSFWQYELIDLRDYPMDFIGNNNQESVLMFNNKLQEMDGYIFIVAEYNHSIPGVLKNALDWVNNQMANKPAAIISYGAVGGARSGEHLRLILAQLQVADISRQVLLSIYNDFENFTVFKPQQLQYQPFKEMIEQLEQWVKAFKTIR